MPQPKIGIFLSSTFFFIFGLAKSHFQSLSFWRFSLRHQSLAPYHLSAQLSDGPSLPYWMPSVILPIPLPLTWGMTKTVNHLQAHLYLLFKCIRQPLLYETEYIEWKIFLMTQESCLWTLIIVQSYIVIRIIKVYRLLAFMLNGFLLKFIVKKNVDSTNRGGYVLCLTMKLIYIAHVLCKYTLFISLSLALLYFSVVLFVCLLAYLLFVCCYWEKQRRSLWSNVDSQYIYIQNIISFKCDLQSFIQPQNYNSNIWLLVQSLYIIYMVLELR